MSCLIDVPQEEGDLSFHACAPSVRLLEPQHVQRWDEFVMSMCPEATFFHRAGWQTVIERAFGHKTWFLFAESDGIIQGVLPLAEIDSVLFGHSLSSLPFCVYGGIAATTESAREVLDSAAQALASRLKVDYLEYRNLKDISFPMADEGPLCDVPERDGAGSGGKYAGDPAQAAGDGAQGNQGRTGKYLRRRY